jgi:hypothetical protein
VVLFYSKSHSLSYSFFTVNPFVIVTHPYAVWHSLFGQVLHRVRILMLAPPRCRELWGTGNSMAPASSGEAGRESAKGELARETAAVGVM